MEPKRTRLSAIEKPRGRVMRLAYWLSRRRFGKVLTPLKVQYARLPRLIWIARQFEKMENSLSLEPGLRHLVNVQVARLNGCQFCEDLGLAMAVKAHIGAARFAALEDYQTSDAFSARERAALAFAEEATRAR